MVGYVIKHFYDNNLWNKEWDNNVKVYCCSYGKQFNLSWFKQVTDEFIKDYDNKNIQVYMIDYAIQPNSDMIKFNNYCKMKGAEFIWIDHHVTAIENVGVDVIKGFQDIDFSGSFNTWAYIMEKNKEVKKAPKILLLIHYLDTWKRDVTKFSWEDEIMPITYYLESLGIDLNDNTGRLVSFLKNAFDDDDKFLDEPILIGRSIYNYIKSLYNKNVKKIYNIKWNRI